MSRAWWTCTIAPLEKELGCGSAWQVWGIMHCDAAPRAFRVAFRVAGVENGGRRRWCERGFAGQAWGVVHAGESCTQCAFRVARRGTSPCVVFRRRRRERAASEAAGFCGKVQHNGCSHARRRTRRCEVVVGEGNPWFCRHNLGRAQVVKESDATGAVHGGVHRETLREAPNTSVSKARVGRCAIAIGDARVSLDASSGTAPLGFATQVSRWTCPERGTNTHFKKKLMRI